MASNTNFNAQHQSSFTALQDYAEEMDLEKSDLQEIERRLPDAKDAAQFQDAGYHTLNTKLRSFQDAWERLEAKNPKLPGIAFDEGYPRQSGLAMPVRTVEGGASSIVVRAREGGYKSMKSSNKSTVRQLTHVSHIKHDIKIGDTPKIRVTEGILKADIASLLGDLPTIGIHGVGSIPKDFEDILKKLNVGWIYIALDVEDNPATERMTISPNAWASSQ
jgi:hypothetical protein